jgi:hypothetical protein
MYQQENRIGEVIETGTAEFIAQCYELYQSPPLGSLVKVGDEAASQYAIVYNVTTASIEPGRRPIARGKDETSEEGVYRSSPQLLKLLRTEFNALVVGYREGEKVFHYLPPQPAKIHSFIYECDDDEVKEFGESFDFLNILINASLPVPVEEILAASLRRMSHVYDDPQRFLVSAGKELAVLMGADYSRLKSVLSKIG